MGGFKVPAIPGVVFRTWQEAQDAAEAKRAEQQRIMTDKKLDEFDNVGRSMVMSNAASAQLKSMPDRGTNDRGVPVAKGFAVSDEQSQAIQKADEVEKKYGNIGDLRMARLMGLYGDNDPRAKNLVSGLENEAQEERLAAGSGTSTAELRKRELDQQIGAMPEGEQKEWMKENYYMLLTAPSGVFKWSPTGLKGRANEQEALLPGKLDEKKAVSEIDVDASIKKKQAELDIGGAKEKENEIEIAQTALSLIEDIINHPGKKGAVGFKGLTPAYLGGIRKDAIEGTDEAGFEQLFSSFQSVLTLENLGLMKGVLSDNDIKILKDAALALSPRMKESEFDARIKLAREKLEKALGKSEDDEFDTLWNDK